ncbi:MULTISPECIES: peptidoglycan D,D-transpeptidase FtsI family protein [unclassified Helicobacter]|uniref:peptidoglycan D,D-transpeptidase FtsI family protein n=1 Tax=unclassified Helicobacter TaxID=2593540 RepID=UPI000CF14DA2|nr:MULTISPECIES: penicillin-binding protein 2 [unclassified Helicobacter]
MEVQSSSKSTRALKVFFTLSFLSVCVAIFAFVISYKVFSNSSRSLSLITSKTDIAVRGDIFSSDDFTLASSKKLYKVSVNTNSINPDKKALFVRLFSIYSGIAIPEILEKLKRRGYVVLSFNLTSDVAKNLKQLNSKLLALNVFQEYVDKDGRFFQKMGLNVEVSGVSRVYAYNDALEPVLGYVQKKEEGLLTKPNGIKGVERYYNQLLEPIKDGLLKGKRDIGFNIIYDRDTLVQDRQDGADIYLTINLRLQKKIEALLDSFNTKYQAQEIVAGVMDPSDGSILVLATTNRFDPKNIWTNDYLNASISEKSFEPGSTIKPIVFSILLEKKLINPLESIDLNKGFYQLGRYTIKDDTFPVKNSIVQDVLIRSSNVGMVKLTKKLSGQEFYDGLKSFGISETTGIDLPYEKSGVIPSPKKLSGEIYKASASYGYGLSSTFIQLLRAYGAFCNDGFLVTPHLVSKIVGIDGVKTFEFEKKRAISASTARKIQEILIKTVEDGTGKRAKIDGLVVGGKTGTARIAKKGGGYYDDLYNGSFFGFVRMGSKNYVIGVVTFGSHGKEDYYGSQTAAPVFKEIVQAMQKQDFLRKE